MKQKPLSEKEITYSIRSLLKTYKIFHWKVWQGLGSAPGVSDIIGVYKGIPLFLEIKTEKGKLSPHQVYFLANVNENGGLGVVLRRTDDGIAFIKGLINGKNLSDLREQFSS